MYLKGNILTGEYDAEMNEFSLQGVKHFSVESTLNEKQLNNLYRYLVGHQNDTDGQIITLYDQMPVALNQEEIKLLIEDLKKVRTMYQ